VAYTEARLHRWGRWLKGRRPRIAIERIDPEMITRYIANWRVAQPQARRMVLWVPHVSVLHVGLRFA